QLEEGWTKARGRPHHIARERTHLGRGCAAQTIRNWPISFNKISGGGGNRTHGPLSSLPALVQTRGRTALLPACPCIRTTRRVPTRTVTAVTASFFSPTQDEKCCPSCPCCQRH